MRALNVHILSITQTQNDSLGKAHMLTNSDLECDRPVHGGQGPREAVHRGRLEQDRPQRSELGRQI